MADFLRGWPVPGDAGSSMHKVQRHSHKLNRSVRKSLFKYNIWQPRSRSSDISSAEFTSMEAAANITIGLLNARSVCNKALLIRDLIIDRSLDVLALTEIWNPSNCTIAELLPPGYEIVHKPHQDKRGGGVAVIARTKLRCKLKIALALTSFEAIIVTITSDQKVINMCLVYAPECKQSSAQLTTHSSVNSRPF